MSGGSFNYLCDRPVEKLFESTVDAEEMVRVLNSLGDGPAASDTYRMITLINKSKHQVERLSANLHNVWHAVEWHRSGDYTEDQLREVVAQYKPLL